MADLRTLLAVSGTVAMIAVVSVASADETSVQRRSGDDLYAAGASVQLPQPVTGDAVMAGGSVLISQDVGQDVLAAGGNITVTHEVGDDIRAAGGSITVTERVGGDAVLAGGSVTLAPGSRVAGNAWLAGGVVHVSGTVNGELRAIGGDVVINGRVDGDAHILSNSLEIETGAVIDGTVYYRGPHPARVEGKAQVARLVYTQHHFEGRGVPLLGRVVWSFAVFMSLALCTLLLSWLLPNVSREALANAGDKTLLSLGLGLSTVIVTPVLVVLLFALLLTAPLAVIVAAAYVLLLAGGSLVAVACLGAWLQKRFLASRGKGTGWYVVSVLGAALGYWILTWIPFIGIPIVLLAFATGAGGLILLTARLYKQSVDP